MNTQSSTARIIAQAHPASGLATTSAIQADIRTLAKKMNKTAEALAFEVFQDMCGNDCLRELVKQYRLAVPRHYHMSEDSIIGNENARAEMRNMFDLLMEDVDLEIEAAKTAVFGEGVE